MTNYILSHSLEGERRRLDMMASMLDPHLFFRLNQIGIQSGWNCLEIGAGVGSVSKWLAEQVGPDGKVTVSDIDTKFIDELAGSNIEVRQIDAQSDDLGGDYDLVITRACLHHLPQRQDVLRKMIGALRPGGWLIVEEPDFFAAEEAENPMLRGFWESFLAWAGNRSVDYYTGRRLGPWFTESGLEDVVVFSETIPFQGGTERSEYWAQTYVELGPSMLKSGLVPKQHLDAAMDHFADPNSWIIPCSFVFAAGRKPEKS